MEKPEIIYPCKWPYRVIGMDAGSIKSAITEVLKSNSYEIDSGNTSKQGKYSSVHIEVMVAHEEERNAIYRALKAISTVKMVF